MKLDELRKIIREEVRSAVKDELQDVITEAVTIASNPNQNKPQEISKNRPERKTYGKDSTLNEMLNQTATSMTQGEYRNIYTGTSDLVQKPNFANQMASQMGINPSSGPAPGIDISQLSFVSKAKSVLDASIKKDKERTGATL